MVGWEPLVLTTQFQTRDCIAKCGTIFITVYLNFSPSLVLWADNVTWATVPYLHPCKCKVNRTQYISCYSIWFYLFFYSECTEHRFEKQLYVESNWNNGGLYDCFCTAVYKQTMDICFTNRLFSQAWVKSVPALSAIKYIPLAIALWNSLSNLHSSFFSVYCFLKSDEEVWKQSSESGAWSLWE